MANESWHLQRKLAGNARVVLDVGASVGRTVGRYLEMFPEATVWAFEPAPDNIAAFKKRLKGHRRVTLIEAAVSDRFGQMPLRVYGNRNHHSFLEREDESAFKSVMVETVALAPWCASLGIVFVDVLKMDVQGAELSVLRGAEALLAKSAIDLMYIELTFVPEYRNQARPWEILRFLERYDYILYSLHLKKPDAHGRLLSADGTFVRRL